MVGGNQPTGLDVSPDGTLLAFTDLMDNRVPLYATPPIDTLMAGNVRWIAAYKGLVPKKKATQTTQAARLLTSPSPFRRTDFPQGLI